MVSRIGAGLFVSGAFATVLGVIATAGNVVAPDFNGWRVVFHAGVLVLFLAGATIVVEPTTPGEVLIATAVGVVGQAVVSVVLVVVSGESPYAVLAGSVAATDERRLHTRRPSLCQRAV